MPASFPRPELIASVDWLAEHLSRPGVRVLDCRWRVDGSSPRLFVEGHVPGAVLVQWPVSLVDRSDPLPFQLAGPEAFAAAMVEAGLGDGMTAVVYDDTGSLYASRVWWSLLVYGFRSVRVLDGGWPAWQASGRPASTGPGRLEPVTFTPRTDPSRRLSAPDVRALLASRDVVLVDARAPAEYLGQASSAGRLGHIPGAVNVPASVLTYPETGRFGSADRLARLLRDRGIERGRRIVVYDSAGIGAAKAAFAFTLMGFPDVAVYDAGWADWGTRNEADFPVER